MYKYLLLIFVSFIYSNNVNAETYLGAYNKDIPVREIDFHLEKKDIVSWSGPDIVEDVEGMKTIGLTLNVDKGAKLTDITSKNIGKRINLYYMGIGVLSVNIPAVINSNSIAIQADNIKIENLKNKLEIEKHVNFSKY